MGVVLDWQWRLGPYHSTRRVVLICAELLFCRACWDPGRVIRLSPRQARGMLTQYVRSQRKYFAFVSAHQLTNGPKPVYNCRWYVTLLIALLQQQLTDRPGAFQFPRDKGQQLLFSNVGVSWVWSKFMLFLALQFETPQSRARTYYFVNLWAIFSLTESRILSLVQWALYQGTIGMYIHMRRTIIRYE